MKSAEFFALCLVMTVVSFLGFVVENVWLAVTKGFMDNRNMCLPFLLGYGLAIVAIYLMFGTPLVPRFFKKKILIQNVVLRVFVYFLIVCVCVSVGEIMLGTLVEHTCGVVWWNYSSLPLHITKYTSVFTSIGFGALITVFMRHFFVPLYEYFLKIDGDDVRRAVYDFMVLLVVDFVYSMHRIYKKHCLTQYWRIDTTNTRLYHYLHVQKV